MAGMHRTRSISRVSIVFLTLALIVLGAGACQTPAIPTLPAATLVVGPQPATPIRLPTPEPTAPPPPTATDVPPTATPIPPTPVGDTFTLTILHTNDTTGWLEPCG